jgi:hypothetical protein
MEIVIDFFLWYLTLLNNGVFLFKIVNGDLVGESNYFLLRRMLYFRDLPVTCRIRSDKC